MAKGPGTVGRKGRETPPAYGPVIKRPPRSRGGGGGAGIGRGMLPESKQPRPDVEWYENDQRPVKVSDRVYAPQTGPHAETYKTALNKMDEVHGVKASQNPTQVRAENRPGSGVLGFHQGTSFVETEPGPDQGKVRELSNVTLNTGYHKDNEPAKRATLYHEFGHANDRQQNFEEKVIPNTRADDQYYKRKYDSENAFRKVQKSGNLEPERGDTPTVQWAKSVQRSKSFKALEAKKEKAKKDGTNRNLIEHLEYLTDPKEVYARSYAQHIARNADPAVEKHWRDDYKKKDADHKKFIGYDQWRGKDFDSIDDSFNRIYGSRGLDVHNMSHDPRVPVEV